MECGVRSAVRPGEASSFARRSAVEMQRVESVRTTTSNATGGCVVTLRDAHGATAGRGHLAAAPPPHPMGLRSSVGLEFGYTHPTPLTAAQVSRARPTPRSSKRPGPYQLWLDSPTPRRPRREATAPRTQPASPRSWMTSAFWQTAAEGGGGQREGLANEFEWFGQGGA